MYSCSRKDCQQHTAKQVSLISWRQNVMLVPQMIQPEVQQLKHFCTFSQSLSPTANITLLYPTKKQTKESCIRTSNAKRRTDKEETPNCQASFEAKQCNYLHISSFSGFSNNEAPHQQLLEVQKGCLVCWTATDDVSSKPRCLMRRFKITIPALTSCHPSLQRIPGN